MLLLLLHEKEGASLLISVFSPIWFLEMLLIPLALWLLTRSLRRKSREEKLRALWLFSIYAIVYLVVYKTILFLDSGYDAQFFNELPINLCNLSLFFALIAARKDCRFLQAFLFYICPLGALMALLMPCDGFYDVPFWLPRCIGYWGFHLAVPVLSLAFTTSGLYRPRYRDIPAALGVLLGIALFDHGVNVLLRPSLCPEANYCFTFGIEGNPLTEFLMRLIPVPALYLLPLMIPAALVLCAMCWLANLPYRKNAKAV